MDMTLPEVEAWSEPMSEILRRENGTGNDADDHRARVEAEMRRLHG
jgi:hypothetical protein